MDIDPFWPITSIIIESESPDMGNLFVGNIKGALEYNLDKSKIKAVITVAKDAMVNYKNNEIRHLKLNVLDEDQENLAQYFEQCYQFIEENLQQTNVLVHCLAGVSRSITIIISYLMKKRKLNFDEALEFVKIRRCAAWPNDGFKEQLKQYYQQLSMQIQQE